MTPTTTELRAAYDRAWDLRRQGISFAAALADPLLRRALEAQANAHRRITEATGRAVPVQSDLFNRQEASHAA